MLHTPDTTQRTSWAPSEQILSWTYDGINNQSTYLASGHIYALQPDWAIRHQHWAQGLAGLISYIINTHLHDSTHPPCPKGFPQQRTVIWAVRAVSQTWSIFPLPVRATLMKKPQPKDTQGDKGRYENNVQLVQWISSVYKSANDRYMETCLVQWISSEIKLRKSHCTGRNPKPYAGAYYIIIMNKGNGNIDKNPDKKGAIIKNKIG